MTVPLRTLCLAFVALLFALAPAAHAGGGCCHAAERVAPPAAAVDVGQVDGVGVHAGRSCCCGTNCHCTPRAPDRDCGCQVPAPAPQPAVPALPQPPLPGAAPARPAAPEVPPHLAFAQRLCAATASGLPNVLLPGRSRQVALSVWRC